MSDRKKKTQLKNYLIIAAAIIGAILLVLPHLISKEDSKEEQKETEVIYYSDKIEEKIEKLISGADGVGKSQVVVTLDTAGEYVFAQNETKSEKASAAEYVIVNTKNGEEPVTIGELYPKIRGVAVVCEGGGDVGVKKRVTELIAAALGIPTNKIAVSG